MTAPRSYTTGLPVTLTVHDDGTVTYEVDLSEAVHAVIEYDPEYMFMYDEDGEQMGVTDDVITADRTRVTTAIDAHYAGTRLQVTPTGV